MPTVDAARANLADAYRTFKRAGDSEYLRLTSPAAAALRDATVAAHTAADDALAAATDTYRRSTTPDARDAATADADAAIRLLDIASHTASTLAPAVDLPASYGHLRWIRRDDRSGPSRRISNGTFHGPTARQRRQDDDFAYDTNPGPAPHWAD